jgi:prepilin-type N-terminal cleavage/methylation domain-containing protein
MNIHHGHHADTGRRGFTLIELLVVFVITLVLLTLVLSGLNRATKAGRRASTQESVSSLAKAVDQFKQEFGFLPPLVHDGMPVSAGDSAFRPADFLTGGSLDDGPTFLVTDGPYEYQTLVVWNEGVDAEFFRGRNNGGPYESGWDEDQAWNDRRYSKYSLAFYLTGVLDKNVDGVRGPGMTRPIVDGSFLGVGYPVGSVRETYEPLMDTERRGAQIVNGYVEPKEVVEHDNSGTVGDAGSVRSMYEDYQRDQLFSFVDSFGTAFRYYRWEPGRLVGLQRVINSELDLNIPPVLIDPVEYEKVQNNAMNLERADVSFIGDNTELRDARYAVVSAGPDGYFGTEAIETIAEFLGAPVPSSSEDAAQLRRQVWADNLFEVGR